MQARKEKITILGRADTIVAATNEMKEPDETFSGFLLACLRGPESFESVPSYRRVLRTSE